MNCPNCGHPNEEGAAFCGSCGSPLPSAEQSAYVMPTSPEPAVQPPLPSSSGMAKASMWLGIVSLVLLVLAIVVVAVGVFSVPDFWDAIQDTNPENIDRLIEDPDIQESAQSMTLVSLSSTGCCFLGMLGALLGLIFGIVGISQEQDRPTRNGRTHSIVGIVLSVIPLLCCVATIVAYIVILGGVLPSYG